MKKQFKINSKLEKNEYSFNTNPKFLSLLLSYDPDKLDK